jgi:hypothetical protein
MISTTSFYSETEEDACNATECCNLVFMRLKSSNRFQHTVVLLLKIEVVNLILLAFFPLVFAPRGRTSHTHIHTSVNENRRSVSMSTRLQIRRRHQGTETFKQRITRRIIFTTNYACEVITVTVGILLCWVGGGVSAFLSYCRALTLLRGTKRYLDLSLEAWSSVFHWQRTIIAHPTNTNCSVRKHRKINTQQQCIHDEHSSNISCLCDENSSSL